MTCQVFLLSEMGLLVDTTFAGMGKHIGHASLADIERIELDIYIAEILYNVGLTCLKLSALLFYVRVFIYGLALVSNLRMDRRFPLHWIGIAITFMGCFQCDPPQMAWSLSVNGSCLS